MMVFFRLRSGVTISRITREPELRAVAESYDHDGQVKNHLLFADQPPYGATHWRVSEGEPWQKIRWEKYVSGTNG